MDTPFEVIKNIFEKNELPDSQEAGKFNFIITRYLSLYRNTFLEASDAAFFFGKLPDDIYEKLLYHLIDSESPAPFIKYIKNPKEKKYDKVLLDEVCEFYKVNERHGKEIIDIAKAQKINLKKEFGIK